MFPKERRKSNWSADEISLVISLFTLIFTSWFYYKTTTRNLEHQKIETWQLLRHEFECERRNQRVSLAKSIKRGDHDLQFSSIMDFFDSLGELVRRHEIDEELAKNTFSYYFSGYYLGTEKLILQDHARDQSEYSDVLYLHGLWGDDPLLKTKNDFKEFLESEKKLE